MLRWAFHILTLLSLVLMIASCVAWVIGLSGANYRSIVPVDGKTVFTAGYSRGKYIVGEFDCVWKQRVSKNLWNKSINLAAAYATDLIFLCNRTPRWRFAGIDHCFTDFFQFQRSEIPDKR